MSGQPKILKFQIPLPPADQLQAYLNLGWFQMKGLFGEPDYLKWSHAKGSPRHPGDVIEDA